MKTMNIRIDKLREVINRLPNPRMVGYTQARMYVPEVGDLIFHRENTDQEWSLTVMTPD